MLIPFFHLRNERIDLKGRGEKPFPGMPENDPASLSRAMPDRPSVAKASVFALASFAGQVDVQATQGLRIFEVRSADA